MNIRALLMGLAFALMWSSAFTSARIIVQDAPPLASLSLRFFLSGVIGILIAKALGQHWHLTRGQWRAVFVFGLCQNALYLGLNFVAMQTVEASLASIIASTMPLIVAGAGWIFLKDRLPMQGILGLALGIIGVVIIMGARFGGNADTAPELPRELFEEQAKRRVVVGLLLGEVIKSEELKADDEKVKALINEMASAYEDPTEVVAYYEGNEQMMNNMRNVALEEQAIDAILAKAQVSEKEVGFNELMNQQPA